MNRNLPTTFVLEKVIEVQYEILLMLGVIYHDTQRLKTQRTTRDSWHTKKLEFRFSNDIFVGTIPFEDTISSERY